MNGLFKNLENEDFFTEYVTAHFRDAPAAVIQDFPCKHVLNDKRVAFAFGEYAQNIKQFSVLLHSENPDHYKRAGAMLHALYKSNIVEEVAFSESAWGSIEEVESGAVLGISYNDAQQMIAFPVFYQALVNELLAFDLSYQLCASYEQTPRPYGFSYLYNVCHYLRKNKDLNVDSLSMIFRSLMT